MGVLAPMQPRMSTSYTDFGVSYAGSALTLYNGVAEKPTAEEIVALYDLRRMEFSEDIIRCKYVREHYNGDVAIYLPSVDRTEQVAIANFFAQSIDQNGMRIASVMPMIDYMAVLPGNRASERRATNRKRATVGWLEHNEYDLKMYRRARLLQAYACSPVSIGWDKKSGMAKWRLRDPFSSYPSPILDPDDMTPENVIFDYQRSWDWLRQNYPVEVLDQLKRATQVTPDTMFTVLEYMDDQVRVMLVVGDRTSNNPSTITGFRGRMSTMPMSNGGWSGTAFCVELERVQNVAGINLYVSPGRITLDRPQGQMDSSIGLFQMQAKLMALEVEAITQSTFPREWAISHENDEVEIVKVADGAIGQIGEVRGGIINTVTPQPNMQIGQAMDRLEDNIRQNGSVPAQYGGQAPSNVRTGAANAQIISAVADFNIQQAQKTFARSQRHEIQRAIALTKVKAGNVKKTFFVSWKGAKGQAEYTPNVDFENDDVAVAFAAPGTDKNSLLVEIGQSVSLDLMSHYTARELHPDIADPELEHRRIIIEGLEQAQLSGLQAQAQQGTLPGHFIDLITRYMLQDQLSLGEAYAKAQQDVQQLQATPAAPGSPETQPGMAQPGMGAEQPVASVAAPAPSVANLSQTLGDMRRSIHQLPQEKAASPQLA